MLSIIAAALAFAAPASAGEDIFARADKNGDGLVTREEALAAREDAFKRADRNGDGVLNAADTPKRPALASEYRQRTAQFKKQFDLNGDGAVTLEEVRSAPMTAFDAADANKDGALDKAEIAAAQAALKAKRP